MTRNINTLADVERLAKSFEKANNPLVVRGGIMLNELVSERTNLQETILNKNSELEALNKEIISLKSSLKKSEDRALTLTNIILQGIPDHDTFWKLLYERLYTSVESLMLSFGGNDNPNKVEIGKAFLKLIRDIIPTDIKVIEESSDGKSD